MKIDLHLHSHFSDGLPTPTQVVRNAHRVGIELMALTDHDTVGGLAEAATEAHRLGMGFVLGVEMTTSCERLTDSEVHILGYHIDPENQGLLDANRHTAACLRRRLQANIERLREHGFETSIEEVEAASPETHVLDRPHLARVMVNRGFVPTFHDAFVRHLGEEGDCHVALGGLTVAETVRIIREAGGLAVLAHPRYYDFPRGATSEDVAWLASLGIRGIEVYHSSHTPEEVERFTEFADEYDLIVTGGTDCHGAILEDGAMAIEHSPVPPWVGDQFLRRCEELI
jgi:predicted metal-dependent phosphoesterase TrpH